MSRAQAKRLEVVDPDQPFGTPPREVEDVRNPPILSRDQLLAACQPSTKTVLVDGLGQVEIGTIDWADQQLIERAALESPDDVNLYLIVAGVKQPQLEPDDVEVLRQNGQLAAELILAIIQHNNLGLRVAEAAQNRFREGS